MKNFRKAPYIISLFIFAAACNSGSRMSLYNLSYLYPVEPEFTELRTSVFNVNDSVSTLLVGINLHDLLYTGQKQGPGNFAAYRISYRMMGGYDSPEILDSASQIFTDSVNFGKPVTLINTIDIPAKYPGDYLLEVELDDLNRKESVKSLVNVYKSGRNSFQDFMILNDENRPLFKNYLAENERFRIICNDTSIHELFVRYYHRDFPVARPPFVEERGSVFSYKADSLYKLPLASGISEWLTIDSSGFYHFQKDSTIREGLTLFRFFEGFPEITTADQLVFPLKYITTRKEYDSLVSAGNMKEAADQFWIGTAGIPERAKVLLQKYYNNVEDANRYFTSYHEGWKTDRGLIYIVFGEPDHVYRAQGQEEWIYGDPNLRNSLRFTFVQVKNPFTDNDYSLLRTPTLKEPWYITVQSWRR